jgi:hypothetical protein
VGINPLQSLYKRKTKIISRVPSATANALGKAGVGGNLREAIFGATIALPLVMTVTVKAAGAPVLRTFEAGAWHVAPKGAPVQVKEMVRGQV